MRNWGCSGCVIGYSRPQSPRNEAYFLGSGSKSGAHWTGPETHILPTLDTYTVQRMMTGGIALKEVNTTCILVKIAHWQGM